MALRVAGLLVVVQSLEYLLGEACTVVKEQWKAISLCELSRSSLLLFTFSRMSILFATLFCCDTLTSLSYSELIVEGKINQVRQLGQLGMARQDHVRFLPPFCCSYPCQCFSFQIICIRRHSPGSLHQSFKRHL